MQRPTQAIPPCCCGADISPRAGRRMLRRTSNGLGLFLFCCGMASSVTTWLLTLFLQAIGYRGSLLYAAYSNLHPSLYYLLVSAAFTLSFFVPGLLYLAAARMPLGQALPTQRTAPSVWLALFFLGCGLALMANLPVNWLSDWISALWPQAEPTVSSSLSGYPAATPVSILLALVRTIVLPAFFEEFIFRGILLGQMRRYGDGLAVLVSAMLFGLFHTNVQQIPFAFLVGLAFGFILVKTNNIWITIAAHGFNNAFACVPSVLKPLLPANLYAIVYNAVFYGMIVMAALAALFLLWRKREIFLPRAPGRQPLSLLSRCVAWLSAPGTWLVVVYCVAKTAFPWF